MWTKERLFNKATNAFQQNSYGISVSYFAEKEMGKSKRLLGWQPRANDEAVVATAQSLIDLRLVK